MAHFLGYEMRKNTHRIESEEFQDIKKVGTIRWNLHIEADERTQDLHKVWLHHQEGCDGKIIRRNSKNNTCSCEFISLRIISLSYLSYLSYLSAGSFVKGGHGTRQVRNLGRATPPTAVPAGP